ncbi:MAG: glycosyltransferase family 39 protein [Planctomycetota bacterium]|nr:glycosyltransferase family 39 protein [Planctomycetota bacterium]
MRAETDRAAGGERGAWASELRGAALLTLAVTAARLVWLWGLCPLELVADEAQYWDWSRRLELSYYTKGPGVAWLIAGVTGVLGESEAAIRTGAALAGGATMMLVAALSAALARAIAADGGGREAGRRAAGRAALLGAGAAACLPAYQAVSVFMTIDGPYVACWAAACLSAWKVVECGRAGGRAMWWWGALGAALGAGVLFKYAVLLLAPGLVAWMVMERRRGGAGVEWRGVMLALVLLGAGLAPIAVWNQEHGWPTVQHLLGHVQARGEGGGRGAGYEPRWTVEFVAAQLGMNGPLVLLMIGGVRAALRGARRREGAEDGAALRRAAGFALWTGGPILAFYLLVTLRSDVEANWPIAGYASLVALAGAMLPGELERWRAARGAGERGARRLMQVAWHWSIGWGAAASAGLMLMPVLDRAPYVGDAIPLHRFMGHEAYAARVAAVAEAARGERADGSEVVIAADQYTRTALLAYYMPGRPRVVCARGGLGGERTAYDFFDDGALDVRAAGAGPVVLVGGKPERWREAFGFTSVDEVLMAEDRRAAVYLGWVRATETETEGGVER